MQLTISHVTEYRYDAPVPYALQQLKLMPKSRAGQNVLSWSVSVEGGRKELDFDDHNNNHVDLVSIEAGRQDIRFHCEGVVETTDTAGIIGQHGGFTPVWYFARPTELTKPGPLIRKLTRSIDAGEHESEIARMHALSQAIAAAVSYETRTTHSQTAAEDAVAAGTGVCQDHAHIFVASARLLGMPARYVSGYLMMDDRVDQEASPAWAEAYIDDIGWVGFDVSNGISPDERYVRVATGPDYRAAAPVSGMRLGDSIESMNVTLQVQQ